MAKLGTKNHPIHAKTVLRKRETIWGYLQHLDALVRHAQKSYAPLEDLDHEHPTPDH